MALVPQNDPQFSNQGQLDWVALAKAPVTFTFESLARYSKAGVNTLTVVAGRAVCSSLIIPGHIEKSLLEQISRLPRIALYGKVAWFGFELQHVLQDLTENEGGVSCFALCGCLMHTYDSFYAAQVLRAFCKLNCPDIPSHYLPGFSRGNLFSKSAQGPSLAPSFRS